MSESTAMHRQHMKEETPDNTIFVTESPRNTEDANITTTRADQEKDGSSLTQIQSAALWYVRNTLGHPEKGETYLTHYTKSKEERAQIQRLGDALIAHANSVAVEKNVAPKTSFERLAASKQFTSFVANLEKDLPPAEETKGLRSRVQNLIHTLGIHF